jgi:hypothetical protein
VIKQEEKIEKQEKETKRYIRGDRQKKNLSGLQC